MENLKKPNYITDKFIIGLESNIIPVYYGSDNICDYFNKERFINIDNFMDDNIINQIEEILNDDTKYVNKINQPIYHNNRIPFLLYNISNTIRKLFNIERKQKNHFLSFGGPDESYHNTLYRVCRQAIEFNIFDEIHPTTEEDLKKDQTIWNKHGNFIENNVFYGKGYPLNRGYGYWLWKPCIIKKLLDQISMNDIIVYCDAGCELNKPGLQRVFEYIDVLNLSITYSPIVFHVLNINSCEYPEDSHILSAFDNIIVLKFPLLSLLIFICIFAKNFRSSLINLIPLPCAQFTFNT
jgi:hypothetical protein